MLLGCSAGHDTWSACLMARSKPAPEGSQEPRMRHADGGLPFGALIGAGYPCKLTIEPDCPDTSRIDLKNHGDGKETDGNQEICQSPPLSHRHIELRHSRGSRQDGAPR